MACSLEYQECAQSSEIRPMYLLLHHTNTGTEPSIQELNERFLAHNDRFLGQYLIPTQFGSLNRKTQNNIYDAYSKDLRDRVALDNEILRWKAMWELADGAKPKCLADTLRCTKEDLYPSVSTPKRLFSTMRRVKTYLPSTMSTARLLSLDIVHAYKDFPTARESSQTSEKT